MASASETPTGQSDYTNAQLYELVKEATLRVRPNLPYKLSTREFDRNRALVGHPNAPSGRWIAKRLGKSWPELVALVLDEGRDRTMSDAAARRPPAEKWLDERHSYFALRFVGKERGEESFSGLQYETTREEILTADALRGGNVAGLLPSYGQIIQIERRLEKKAKDEAQAAKDEAQAAKDKADTKSDAADADGAKKSNKGKAKKPKAKKQKATKEPLVELEEDDRAEDLGEEEKSAFWNKALVRAGLVAYEQSKERGVPWPRAIHLYIEATGGLIPPSGSELRRFAGAASFSLPNKGPLGTDPKAYLAEVAALRNAIGLPMAYELAQIRGGWNAPPRPVFDLTKLPADLPPPLRTSDYWSSHEDEVISALCEYLDTLGPRHVAQWSREDYRGQQEGRRRGVWPAASTLGRVGEKSFTKWMERAVKEWEARKKKAA